MLFILYVNYAVNSSRESNSGKDGQTSSPSLPDLILESTLDAGFELEFVDSKLENKSPAQCSEFNRYSQAKSKSFFDI